MRLRRWTLVGVLLAAVGLTTGVTARGARADTGTSAKGCIKMGFDTRETQVSPDGTGTTVVSAVQVRVPGIAGPVIAHFASEVVTNSGSSVGMRLTARCVAPPLTGGCTVGDVTAAVPGGGFTPPEFTFFQLNAPQAAESHAMIGVFPSLVKGHYVFEALGLSDGNSVLQFRTLVVQVNGVTCP